MDITRSNSHNISGSEDTDGLIDGFDNASEICMINEILRETWRSEAEFAEDKPYSYPAGTV